MRAGCEIHTLKCESFTGTAMSVLPRMQLIDTLQFRTWMSLSAIQFATSIVGPNVANAFNGAFLVLDHTEESITLSSSLNILAQRVGCNSGQNNASHSSDWLFFPNPIDIRSQQPISLYVTTPIAPGIDSVTAVASLMLSERSFALR